ncbi:hypothetical protein Drorol1_Dr00021295 [Drosera rotundifolia]
MNRLNLAAVYSQRGAIGAQVEDWVSNVDATDRRDCGESLCSDIVIICEDLRASTGLLKQDVRVVNYLLHKFDLAATDSLCSLAIKKGIVKKCYAIYEKDVWQHAYKWIR